MRAPILLLHGALDTPDVWSRVAPRLEAAGWRVALDRSEALSPVDEAARLAKTLSAPVHLVGHSRGGTAAGWLAAERPELARSLAVVASPPQASEAFRAAFRKRLERAPAADHATLEYLARIPDDDFPQHALRRYRGRALVVEYEDDPLYSPTQTLFWRMFLPYADFERVPGGHRAFAESDEAAAWLASRILRHLEHAEPPTPRRHDRHDDHDE